MSLMQDLLPEAGVESPSALASSLFTSSVLEFIILSASSFAGKSGLSNKYSPEVQASPITPLSQCKASSTVSGANPIAEIERF